MHAHAITLPFTHVPIGCSLGNRACFVRTTPAGGIDHLWQAATGRWFFGDVALWVESDGAALRPLTVSVLPYAQETVSQGECCESLLRVFVPAGEISAVCLILVVRNAGPSPRTVTVRVAGQWNARPSAMHRRQPQPDDINRQFPQSDLSVIWRNGYPVGTLSARSNCGDSLLVSLSGAPVCRTEADGRWCAECSHALVGWETIRVHMTLQLDASDALDPAVEWPKVLAQVDAEPRLVTPSALLDDGFQWAVRNSARISHRFAQGSGFTNDPPGTLVVTRDAGWFGFGLDAVDPGHVRALWDTLTQHSLYPDNKVAEYIDLNTDPVFRDDYGLNIADPTPLYLLGMAHHARFSGDITWLRGVWPVLQRVCAYLLSQMRDGLVICTSQSREPGRGVCGWRNVMTDENISGAVTELQALSAAALYAVSELAEWLGHGAEARALRQSAEAASAALESLRHPQTGGYLLCRRSDGTLDLRRTVDQLFPLVFGLAPADAEQAVWAQLTSPEFLTDWGVRTAPADAPEYHPEAQWGLTGGVWPNAAAWLAFVAMRLDPERAVWLAEQQVRPLCLDDYREHGALAPGQFPEWYHGDVLVSRGMSMSPWMPPTYLWLMIEGLLGLHVEPDRLSITPHLPAGWEAAGIGGLRVHGRPLSVIVTPDVVYTTQPMKADRTVVQGCEAADAPSGRAVVIACDGLTVRLDASGLQRKPWDA